jgi:hypothetical protein
MREVDLVLERSRQRLAFEFKASLTPELTKGGHAALKVVRPKRTFIVCPMHDDGYDPFPDVRVCGINEALRTLRGMDRPSRPE